jgi:hypothetical protein
MANSRHAFFGETTYLFENSEYVSEKMLRSNKKLFTIFTLTTKNPPVRAGFLQRTYELVAHTTITTKITTWCAFLERTCFVYRE